MAAVFRWEGEMASRIPTPVREESALFEAPCGSLLAFMILLTGRTLGEVAGFVGSAPAHHTLAGELRGV
jgi:hypothetical protein